MQPFFLPLLVNEAGVAPSSRDDAEKSVLPIRPHFGLMYLLLAGSLALPMTARSLLFNQTLGLSKEPELLTAYYMAEWSTGFAAPIVGWLTDLGGPTWRRRAIVACLLAKGLFILAFAVGLVQSLGALYAIGLPAAMLHSFSLAALNGALIADGNLHGGGDTSEARRRQSAKVICSSLGDFCAFIASTALEGAHASQGLVFALTAGLVGIAAVVACRLPLPTAASGGAAHPAAGDDRRTS